MGNIHVISVPSSKSTQRAFENESQSRKSEEPFREKTGFIKSDEYTDPKLIEMLSSRNGKNAKEEPEKLLLYSFNKNEEENQIVSQNI